MKNVFGFSSSLSRTQKADPCSLTTTGHVWYRFVTFQDACFFINELAEIQPKSKRKTNTEHKIATFNWKGQGCICNQRTAENAAFFQNMLSQKVSLRIVYDTGAYFLKYMNTRAGCCENRYRHQYQSAEAPSTVIQLLTSTNPTVSKTPKATKSRERRRRALHHECTVRKIPLIATIREIVLDPWCSCEFERIYPEAISPCPSMYVSTCKKKKQYIMQWKRDMCRVTQAAYHS